jgi:DNA polymerase III sliding clamp (beta) subunit (PCNA family)
MIEVTVPVTHLKALRMHSANNDVRDYLNGIYFDIANGKLVATDGHRMMLVGTTPKHGSFIAPNEFVDYIIKACKGRHAPESVEIRFENGKMECQVGDSTFRANAIDGKFPDYARVIPASLTGEYSHINYEYVYDAAKALALIDGAKKQYAPTIVYNGTGASIAYGANDTALVVLMPLRGDRTDYTSEILKWAKNANSVAVAA